MKFFADEMLGKLARWMRMAGYDVRYEKNIQDDDLVEESKQEGRIILTRDTKLIKHLADKEYLFISHDYLENQSKELFDHYPKLLKEQNPLSRCAECNTPLQSIDKEKVKGKVWPFVYQTQDHFTFCPSCDRIYWRATHVKRIEERLKRLTHS